MVRAGKRGTQTYIYASREAASVVASLAETAGVSGKDVLDWALGSFVSRGSFYGLATEALSSIDSQILWRKAIGRLAESDLAREEAQ